MKTRILWCLVGVNVALLIMLVAPRMKPNAAMAQRADRPSDYLLIPGNIPGQDRGVVYILDSTNSMMSAVTFEEHTGRLAVMQPSDLLRVFEEGTAAPEEPAQGTGNRRPSSRR